MSAVDDLIQEGREGGSNGAPFPDWTEDLIDRLTRTLAELHDARKLALHRVLNLKSGEGDSSTVQLAIDISTILREPDEFDLSEVSETTPEDIAAFVALGDQLGIERGEGIKEFIDTVHAFVVNHPIPEELCGAYSAESDGGCSFLLNHEGKHSWAM